LSDAFEITRHGNSCSLDLLSRKSKPGSIAFMPKSPKEILFPRIAKPRIFRAVACGTLFCVA
jgi:hypothetical protein